MTKLVIHHYLEPAAAPHRARSFARDCGGGCGCRKCREYPRGRDADLSGYTTNQLEEHIRQNKNVGSTTVAMFREELERRTRAGTLHPERSWGTVKKWPRDYDDPGKSRTALEGPDSSVKFVPASRA